MDKFSPGDILELRNQFSRSIRANPKKNYPKKEFRRLAWQKGISAEDADVIVPFGGNFVHTCTTYNSLRIRKMVAKLAVNGESKVKCVVSFGFRKNIVNFRSLPVSLVILMETDRFSEFCALFERFHNIIVGKLKVYLAF